MDLNEPKPILVRLTRRMNWGLRSLLVFVLAGALATSALACPLWMCPMNQGGMPCSDQSSQPNKCPLSICQASSSYLASHVSAHAPLPQELPAEVVDLAAQRIAHASSDPGRRYAGEPPGFSGPLFLQTHSLLI